MSTETKKSSKQTPSTKSEADLGSERAKLLVQIGEFDKELETLAEKHASELAADSPNAQRLDELEEIRDRFKRERERVLGRVKAIDERLIPAARLEATRVTMAARVKESARQGALLEKIHGSMRAAVEVLRKVYAEIPWEHPHPEFIMRKLAEEIGFDAAELGEKSPALDPPPRLSGELGELIGLARQITARLEYVHNSFGPLTTRGQQAQQRQREEAATRMAG